MVRSKCNCYHSGMKSIREQVKELWMENPHITAKPACKKLKLDIKAHGRYVNNLLSSFRCHYIFGSHLGAQGVPHRRVFVWECVPRGVVECGEALRRGWVEVVNRNGMLVVRDVGRGSVHWYKGGLVRLYLRGAVQLARAKELFCRAFGWFTPAQWKKYLDVPLREESKHWVFEVGAPMPRFDIRQFERSHGIRIFADKSHPTAIEIEETQPFWITRFERVTDKLAVEIEQHLNLIKAWQKEAKARRSGVGAVTGQVIRLSNPRPVYLGKNRWWDPLTKKKFIRISPGTCIEAQEGKSV